MVERDEIAKGYEFAKGQYVIFSPEELKALDEKATNAIDVNEFVPLVRSGPPLPREGLLPRPRQGRRARLSAAGKALEETGRAALGQYSARGKQYLVLVRPMDGVLVMEQLHYPPSFGARPTSRSRTCR